MTIVLSMLSLVSIIYFGWYSKNDEPLFFATSWKYHRWPCYFFVCELGIYILHIIWNILKCNSIILKIVYFLSVHSYDIFLSQMIAYVLFNKSLFYSMPISWLFRFLACFVFSLSFAALIHVLFDKLFSKSIS